MISTNLRQVIGEIDKYKIEVARDTKATRDDLARTAQILMKSELSKRQSYTGRGANKKFTPTANGAPPAKQSGTLFRSIKARRWNKAETFGATVGLLYKGRKMGYGDAYYGVILESSNRAGNSSFVKPRVFNDGHTRQASYPQRAPGVHKWASPAFHRFEPMVNPIVAKRLGRVK